MSNLLIAVVAKIFDRNQLPKSNAHIVARDSCYEIGSFEPTSDGFSYRRVDPVSRKAMSISYSNLHWGSQLRINDIQIRRSITGYKYDFILEFP